LSLDPLQHIGPIDLVIERVEPAGLAPLGPEIQLDLESAGLVERVVSPCGHCGSAPTWSLAGCYHGTAGFACWRRTDPLLPQWGS
jgi:hypothetical protein